MKRVRETSKDNALLKKKNKDYISKFSQIKGILPCI